MILAVLALVALLGAYVARRLLSHHPAEPLHLAKPVHEAGTASTVASSRRRSDGSPSASGHPRIDLASGLWIGTFLVDVAAVVVAGVSGGSDICEPRWVPGLFAPTAVFGVQSLAVPLFPATKATKAVACASSLVACVISFATLQLQGLSCVNIYAYFPSV